MDGKKHIWASIFAAIVINIAFFGTELPARAGAIYYDQAAWDAATSQYNSASYPLLVTETDYQYTLEINSSPPFTVIGPSTPTAITGFGLLSGNFYFGSGCEFTPGCLITADLEIVINLPTPIYGFSGVANIYSLTPSFSINGEAVDVPTGFNPYSGFFGITFGVPVETIEIISNAGFTDNPNSFLFSNMNVLTPVNEPPSLVLLLAAVLIFLAAFGPRITGTQ